MQATIRVLQWSTLERYVLPNYTKAAQCLFSSFLFFLLPFFRQGKEAIRVELRDPEIAASNQSADRRSREFWARKKHICFIMDAPLTFTDFSEAIQLRSSFSWVTLYKQKIYFRILLITSHNDQTFIYICLFELLVIGVPYSNWKREDFCRPTGQQIGGPRN